MAIETLEDIIDHLADWVGVYGAHDNDEPRPGFSPELHCRVCFTSAMRSRIMDAVQIETALAESSSFKPPVNWSPAVCRAMATFWEGMAKRSGPDGDEKHGR